MPASKVIKLPPKTSIKGRPVIKLESKQPTNSPIDASNINNGKTHKLSLNLNWIAPPDTEKVTIVNII